ncbi:MAG: hypothetical protein GXY07_05910 [Candidatus Hydrogenedentes bacterium]|jgi:hypothetical protein|nr:hypothetical protein [Candidatus Hydrogenedentota bacterium]
MALHPREMRDIYERTIIVRKPTYGIIKGYHELPYICLGNPLENNEGALRVRGKIHVSPQFVIKPKHYHPNYGDVFGEDGVDVAIAGRMFGFLGFPNKPVECSMDHLEVAHVSGTLDDLLQDSLNELERMEDITTGVIITPESRYYQISLERFIAHILEDEFR